MRSKVFFSLLCLVLFPVSVSRAYYTDITFVTDNIAPTGTMSNIGGAAYHPVLPGVSVANMNVAGTYGNGAISVPMYPQQGYNDNELLIWNDNTPDDQQVMRLTFSSPVNLREVGIIADFSGVGAGSDRFGKEPSFRINGGDWMVYGDPEYNWGLSADVMNWWDYACVTGSFTNVTTVDYRLGDWTAGYSPRIGAVTALGNPEPVQVWNLNSDLANAGGWPANSPVVGPWSMGWSYSLGSQTPFNTWIGGESCVWHTPLSDHFNPGAGGNPDGSTTPHGGYSAGQCILAAANYITGDDNVYEPGSGETYSVNSVVRWTAPVAMEAAITGSFIPLNPGNTDVWVVHNGSALFSQASSGTTPEIIRSFSSPGITLAAGDTIDFIVKRNDNYTGDNNTHTYIDANISIQIAREQSWNPSPHDGARHVLPAALLSWLPGDDAVSYDVYFGTDYQAVTDAGRTSGDFNLDGRVDMDDFLVLINQWLTTPGEVFPTANGTGGPNVDLLDFSLLTGDWLNGTLVFRGNQTATSYNPGGLVAGQTYYWRVDDVTATGMVKGQVWSFTAKTFSDTPAVQTDPVSGDVRIGSEKFELIIETQNGLNPCIVRDLQTGRVLADGDYVWPNHSLPVLAGAPVVEHNAGLWTVTCTAMQGDLEIQQVYTIEDAKPNQFTETIRIRNTGTAPLYTSGFACGFARKLDGGDADEVLASRLSQIPYRIQPENGALCDYSLSTVATGQMWYATVRGWYNPGVDDGGKTYTSTFGSEGWAWYDGSEVLLLEKYHPDAMEWSLMKSVSRYAAGETYREKVLRFGGAGLWKLGDPEGTAQLSPGQSFTFGTTRYEFIDGSWQDAFYSFRGSMEQKGHVVPDNYNPPVHWNELYDNPLWWAGDSAANRDTYYALDDMKAEADKAYAIGCECLYLDPGWDTNFGSNLWGTYLSSGGTYRLGPQEDFIDAMAVGHDHELALALHTPLAAWSDPSSYPASCKRPDGGLCGSSTAYAAEKAARLIATCNGYETNEGAYFVMFDGNWFVGGCTNPTHGHAIPNTRQDQLNATLSICQQLHAVHPNVVIELHDPVIGPGCSRYCPTYILHAKPGSFNVLWGYEYMSYTLAEVNSRRAMNLYYVNLAYNIPIYLHIDLRTDNEKALGFWWFASTCRHLGIGGTHSDPVARQAHHDAMQTYMSLKPFFTQGEFYGIDEAFHAHTLPDQNAAIIVCFNLLDSPDPLAFQFDLSAIGLNEGLEYQITGAETAQRTGNTYSISVQTPTHGVKIIQITPVTN